ncbi:MAG: sensor domain-containing diguanylate cyclase [Actinobacteria bacterium]|nr:sensor domain-containing diguanylate cyclase [Actinomycetota bacterium]
MLPIEPHVKDKCYLGFRFLTLLMMAGWTEWSPLVPSQRQALYLLTLIFAVATGAFTLTGLTRPRGYGRLYAYLLILDISVLSAFIYKAEPHGEYFTIGYFMATALAMYYFGARAGYFAAGMSSIADLVRMTYFTSAPVFASDKILQIGLIWITAIAVGRVAQRSENNTRKIEALNKELERKIAILSSSSRVIHSATDLQKLLFLLRESLERVFDVTGYRFYLMDQVSGTLLAKVNHDLGSEPDVDMASVIANNIEAIQASSLTWSDEPIFSETQRTAKVWYLPGLERFPALIRCGNETVGVLCLDRGTIEACDKEEIDLLINIFNQLTVSMENAVLYDRLKKTSITDHLTRLYNRRYLQKYLTDEVKRCRRYCKELSVVMLDIDNFKTYNDSYGHLQGDVALQELGEILRSSCRDADIVARYGGEEFAIVLPETSLSGSMAVIEKVRGMVGGYLFLGPNAQRNARLTASFGVATYPDDGLTGKDLLLSADKALYLAKTSGKNRVFAFRDLRLGHGRR